MLGFLVGTACLVGLFCVLRKGRGGACWGFSDRHGCPGGGPRERWTGERGGGRWWMLRWLFERLDTTPGQEKVMRSAADELWETIGSFKRTVDDSRRDVARAFRADDFNAEILGDVFSRHDTAMDELRKAAVGALARVHEVLDPHQRARLAELIESMPGRRWSRGGPYRSW
jgi:hypothetical protein